MTQFDDDDLDYTPDVTLPEGWTLVKTCSACPEQYELFDEDRTIVGYFRLRHGGFRVDAPDCGGETVYSAFGYDELEDSDGIFTSERVRVKQMQRGVNAVIDHYKRSW